MSDTCYGCERPALTCICRYAGLGEDDTPPRGHDMQVGIDLSDGVETHVEGYWKNGIFHVTDRYEIVDGNMKV